MKLTAPPPPTEPIADPNNPLSPEDSSANPESNSTPPVAKLPVKMATWPRWHRGTDLVLAALTLAIAFLTASFAARNSDLWLHLGSGKLLTTGEYKLGSDPFSFTAADRPWVNHNWLFDLGAYLLHQGGDGFVLVLVKAIAAALAFAVILAMRRPGQPLWPWAIFGTLAVLASAQYLILRPTIGSMLFLALTLYFLFRMPSPPRSWRLPIAIGITFCLWSNVDAWFFLGPATLALLVIGEAIRRQLGPSDSSDRDAILAALPPLPILMKSLVIGVVACMINPHHVRIWDLPIELTGLAGADDDPRIKLLMVSPLNKHFWTSATLASNANGLAYAMLLAAGAYASFLSGTIGRFLGRAAEVDPLPLPHALLWVGFAALSLLSMYAIPFFALITVWLVSDRLNTFSSRLVLQSFADQRTRMLLTSCTVGRLVTLVALLVLGLIAWPGWLRAPASCWWNSDHRSVASLHVAWAVEPDPELRQAAEWLEIERAHNRLPLETHGLLASVDLANYCAWYAPREKVFANSRYRFHRSELKQLSEVRRGLRLFGTEAEAPDLEPTFEVFERWKVRYVGIAAMLGDEDRIKLDWIRSRQEMWTQWPAWSPWFFNGRTAISGWRRSPAQTDPTFDREIVEPAVLAFGSKVERLVVARLEPPPLPPTAWEEIIQAKSSKPTGVEESLAWLQYKSLQKQRWDIKALGVRFLVSRAFLRNRILTLPLDYIGDRFERSVSEQFAELAKAPWPPAGFRDASVILALRSARRAVAENPDHPDGYFALARVFEDRDLPMSEVERNLALVTAYHQCLSRLPPPDEFKRGAYLASGWQVCARLAELYLGQPLAQGEYAGLRVDAGAIGQKSSAGYVVRVPTGGAGSRAAGFFRIPPRAMQSLPQGSQQISQGLHLLPLDLARAVLIKAEGYGNVEIVDAENRTKILKGLEDQRKSLDLVFQRAVQQFRRASEQHPNLGDRHRIALQFGLISEALERLQEADLVKEFGDAAVEMKLNAIALELALGRIEEAAVHIDQLKEELGANKRFEAVQRTLMELDFHRLKLAGNYAEAGKVLESLDGPRTGLNSLMESLAKEKIDPKNFKDYDAVWPAMARLGVAWPMISMFGASVFGPEAGFDVIAMYQGGRVYLEHFQQLTSAQQAIFNKMRQDAEFFFQRGYLSLLEGDIASAKKRFEQTRQSPPPGWQLPAVDYKMADEFLRLIEAAEARAQP